MASEEFNLSKYEYDVYTTLLKLGKATAYEISKNSKVPSNKVYEIARKLEEKGFITIEEGKPTVYIPNSPTEAVDTYIGNKIDELTLLKDKWVTEFKKIENWDIKQSSEFKIIHSDDVFLKKEYLVAKTATQYDACTDLTGVKRMLRQDFLVNLKRINPSLKIRLLCPKMPQEWLKEIERTGVEVKFRPDTNLPSIGVIRPNGFFIVLKGRTPEGGESKEKSFLWTDHTDFCDGFKMLFDYLWVNS